MPTALVVLAPHFEDIEAVTVTDILHRAGVKITTVALEGAGPLDLKVNSAHGLSLVADTNIIEIQGMLADAIIFPGGLAATQLINSSPGAQVACRAHMKAGKLVCAICAAPAVALGSWHVLDGHRVVHYPQLPKKSEEYLGPNVEYVADLGVRVLVDDNVITSRAPGTAAEFAFAIVEKLCGASKVKELREAMLWL